MMDKQNQRIHKIGTDDHPATSEDVNKLIGDLEAKNNNWRDPTPEELDTPEFNAIWELIKNWDINVPEVYDGYCSSTGNHVVAILDALSKKG